MRNLGWDKKVGWVQKKFSAAQPRFMRNCIATIPAHTKLLTLWRGSFWLELGAWVKKQTRVKFWIFIGAARENEKKIVKLAKCLKFKCRRLQCNSELGRGSRWRYQRHKHRSNFTLSDFSPCKPTIEARDRGSQRKFSYLAKLIQISNRSRDFFWAVASQSQVRGRGTLSPEKIMSWRRTSYSNCFLKNRKRLQAVIIKPQIQWEVEPLICLGYCVICIL